jgi:hypothetical protein
LSVCAAIKPDGARCKARAMKGSQWCFNHHPDYSQERQRNASKGGRRGGRGRPGPQLHTLLEDLIQRVTYADKLLIEGPEEPPDEIMRAVRKRRDELLAAASMLHPPVGWLKELVERQRTGYQHVWKSRQDGNGNPLVTGISLECLATNVASFIGLPPHEGARPEGIIRAALRVEELLEAEGK